MTTPPDPPPAWQQTLDVKYFIVVGILLIAIIATLGGLWIRERRTRIALQQEVNQLRQQVQNQSQTSLLEMIRNQVGQRPSGDAPHPDPDAQTMKQLEELVKPQQGQQD